MCSFEAHMIAFFFFFFVRVLSVMVGVRGWWLVCVSRRRLDVCASWFSVLCLL